MSFWRSLNRQNRHRSPAQLQSDSRESDRVLPHQSAQASVHADTSEQSKSSEVNRSTDSSAPPPSHSSSLNNSDDFQPPPDPPPSHSDRESNPPPYHDWTVVPDTALLPPPPALPQEYSPSNNASYDSAAKAHEWCSEFSPFQPSRPSQQVHMAANSDHLTFDRPSTLDRTADLRQSRPGHWYCRSRRTQDDTIVSGTLPMYFAAVDNPLLTGQEKATYFEVRMLSMLNQDSVAAIGFSAKPYPPWRLPGWHRASLAVHGDDGRRFVNDSWGGRDFVGPFRVGDVIGIGMRFLPQDRGAGKCKTKVFFTRNGQPEAGWDVDEERDAEHDEGVEGLQGELDMYPAIGVSGGLEVEIITTQVDWMYRGCNLVQRRP